MEFHILGPFEVVDQGHRLQALPPKWRSLLAVLVVSANRVVTVEHMIDQLWPGKPPKTADTTLLSYISLIKKALPANDDGEPLIVHRTSSPSGYVLQIRPDQLDSVQFEDAAARARSKMADGEFEAAAAGFRTALALWRGPALAEVCDAPDALLESERLEHARFAAREGSMEAELECGRHNEVVDELGAFVDEDPLREHLWELLMVALYRCGRQAEAVRAHDELRAKLREELGIGPGPAVERCYQEILAQSPGLDWPGSPREAPKRGGTAAPRGPVVFLSARRSHRHRLGAIPEDLEGDLLLIRDCVKTHGGIEESIGEGELLAAFDRIGDAMGAVVAAQQEVADMEDHGPLAVSMAIHAGRITQTSTGHAGLAMRQVGRMSAAAHPGQVVLSEAARTLVGPDLPEGVELVDLGEHRLTDLSTPTRLYEVRHPDMDVWFPALKTMDSRPHNLPLQLTSFVGRTKQLQELLAAMTSSRLCTLTGFGGFGKTRLALQFAAELVDDFNDGVWLVDLTSTTVPNLVAQVVATTLGVRDGGTGTFAAKNKRHQRPPTERLIGHLRQRQVLLILDNCDRVVPACAELVETLLRACPKLRVICTSRQLLGVAGEFMYKVPTLAVPPPGMVLSREEIEGYESVQLFIQRASRPRADVRLEPADLEAVMQICRQLEGLALAIELAAARTKFLSPSQILENLDDRFALLRTGQLAGVAHHQRLEATIDWSHDDLSPPEQVLFRRLAVFKGGFDLAAAKHICSGDSLKVADILGLLGMLVDKSLVETDRHARVIRYRLLDTIRDYGLRKLHDAGEGDALPLRHRAWYVVRAEEAEQGLKGADQLRWLDMLELDHDNLRAALNSVPETELDPSQETLRLAAALGHFWLVRGLLSEGRDHLDRALARRSPGVSLPSAKALSVAGHLAMFNADLENAERNSEAALEMSVELGYRVGEALALSTLGSVAMGRERFADAEAQHRQALAISQGLSDRWGTAFSLGNIANLEVLRGYFAEAGQHYEEALAIRRSLGDAWGMTWTLFRLGVLRTWQGDFDVAEGHLSEGRAHAERLRYGGGLVLTLLGSGDVAHLRGDRVTAKVHYEEALAEAIHLQDQTGISLSAVGLANVATTSGHYAEARRWLDSPEARPSGSSVVMQVDLALLRGNGRLAHAVGEDLESIELHRRALLICQRIQDRRGTIEELEQIAIAAAAVGKKDRAAALIAAASRFRLEPHAPVPPLDDQALATARESVAGVDVPRTLGSSLSMDDAVALALSDDDRPAEVG